MAVAFTVLVKSPYFSGKSFLEYRVGYELGQTHALNVCAAGLFCWNYFYRLVYGHLNEILINVGEDVTVV